jgi:hypothetical protein
MRARFPLKLIAVLCVLVLLNAGETAAQQEADELIDEIVRMSRGLSGAAPVPINPAALVNQELPVVERLSGMKAKHSIRARTAMREEAIAHVRAAIDEQLPPERLHPMETAWRALGLLREHESLSAEIEKLYGSQAGGYYDPATAELVLVRDIPVMVQLPVVRHELVHALQDQTWDLKKWLASATEDEDRGAAIQAVLEGHANDVMNRVSTSGLDLDSLLKASPELAALLESSGLSSQDMPGMQELSSLGLDGSMAAQMLPRGTPPALAAQMLFPYLIGSTFISSYREAHPEDPGCKNLYKRPPRTTAEVIDPRLWEQGGPQRHFKEPGTFLPGFEAIYHSSLGRLLAHVVLTGVGDPAAGDVSAGLWDPSYRDNNVVIASGWEGDIVVVFAKGPHRPGTKLPDRWIVVWCSRWSSAEEAGGIARMLRQRLPKATVHRRGQRIDAIIRSGNAQTDEILEAISSWQ